MFLVWLFSGPGSAHAQDFLRAGSSADATDASTLLVCATSDPYRPLALEISRSESIPVLDSIEEGLARRPRFLIWVGSPAYFSDKALVQAGLAAKTAMTTGASALGIISGATIDDARALWQRRSDVQGTRVFAVNGQYPDAGIEHGRILTPANTGSEGKVLAKTGLIDVLKNADYLTFTGHGGGTYWRLADGVSFTAQDFPALPPLVLGTAGCQSFRLNASGSLAIAAVANGAAAYTGFLFSPIEGYLIGESDGLPFRFTWPGMTIGEVVILQNVGAMRGFAAFPYYFLLGDPRLALQPQGDWMPIGIETIRGVRTLDYGETPAGCYPIRIRNGAQYGFFEIPDDTSAADGDLFYNSRLQTVTAGRDKLLLLMHPGGDLKISMRAEAPRFRWFSQPVLDSLDHTLLYLPTIGTPGAAYITLVLALLGAFYLVRHAENPTLALRRGIAAGTAMGLAHALYALGRIESVTITSKPIGVGAPGILGTVLLATCGMIMFMRSDSIVHRIAGIVVAVLPGVAAAILSASVVFAANTFVARSAGGAGIYNYSMTFLALMGAACQAGYFIVLVLLISRNRTRRNRPRAGK